jgi:thiamine pyrophosphate-dependent acetolactate synthase large subunit-like protein
LIQATSEQYVVGMADGYAKASGRTGFGCFSRVGGPLASSSLYNAMKDRTPLVALTDHADTTSDGRDGHEDLDDWLEPVKQFTKWRWLVKEGQRIPEWVAHAFKLAATAPGGPCFVRIPRNVLYQGGLRAEVYSSKSLEVPMDLSPSPRLVEEAARLLLEARSPLLYVGHEVWSSGGRAAVVELAELLSIPVTQARSWSADFPTDHPLYMCSLLSPMRYPREIDLFLNLGAQMPDQGGGPPLVPRSAKIVHGRIESGQVGVHYPIDLALVADVGRTAKALAEAVRSLAPASKLEALRRERLEKVREASSGLRQAYLESARAEWDASELTWPRLLLTLDQLLDTDAVIVEELGSEDWVLRSFPFADGKKTKLGRTLGRSLGWGVAASIGVKLALPDRQVVSLQGDGGFLFSQAEALWSMSRYDVPVVTLVCNNRSYDEPRNNMLMRNGRARQAGKDMICYLGSPDVAFADLARAFGVKGERVASPAELQPAVERAIAATREGRPYLLDVHVARTGLGAESTWHPGFSLAAARTRKV